MDSKKFKALLKRHIVPIFPGAYLVTAGDHSQLNEMASHDQIDTTRITVQWDKSGDSSRFILSRNQEFSIEDAHFICRILENIHDARSIEQTYLFEEVIPPAIRRAVAQHVARGATDVVVSLLSRFEQWAEQTYEGRPVNAAIGIDPQLESAGDIGIDEILDEGFGVVMANGLETFITVASDGSIRGHQPFPNDAVSTKVLSPLRFAHLAEWAGDGRVGLALTRNGEILVFSECNLRFARRRGIWHYFPHAAVIERMRMNEVIDRSVAKAAYETCLDISFARTGGCIGVLRPDKINAILQGDTISESDRVDSVSPKGRFLRAIIKTQKFQDLDRRLRQDLVAIDGSTILDSTGRILAVGAILKISAGSTSGARESAAKALGHYGLGLKISSDGAIQGFRMSIDRNTKKRVLRKSFQFA